MPALQAARRRVVRSRRGVIRPVSDGGNSQVQRETSSPANRKVTLTLRTPVTPLAEAGDAMNGCTTLRSAEVNWSMFHLGSSLDFVRALDTRRLMGDPDHGEGTNPFNDVQVFLR